MKSRFPIFPAIAAAALALASCSSVFTASLSGRLVDREIYEADDGANAAISEAAIYLYMEETERSTDLSAWDGTDATLPDGSGADYRWFASTTSDEQGDFQFTGIIWENLFPEFGKTADRKEVFLLFHHPRYGLVPNKVPVYVLSDSTYRAGIIKLEDRYNVQSIRGQVLDHDKELDVADSDDGLANATVAIYVAEEWTYDDTGTIATATYPRDPTALVTTDADGWWNREISFRKVPSDADDHESTIVRLVFSREQWTADATTDPDDIRAAPEDFDRDGEEEHFYESASTTGDSELVVSDSRSDGYPVTLAAVTMRRDAFTGAIEGRLFIDDGGTSGIAADGIKQASESWVDGDGQSVELYVGHEAAPDPATTEPDDTTTTFLRETETQLEHGYFRFQNIEWARGDATSEPKPDYGTITLWIRVSTTFRGPFIIRSDRTTSLSVADE